MTGKTGKENRRKLKFNLLDAAVILLVIGAVAGIMLRYNVASRLNAVSSTDQARITFVAKNLRSVTTDAFVPGDIFYWKQNGITIGTLESVNTNYSEVMIHDENFVIKKTINDQRYDVKGVILADGNDTGAGFMLNGTQYIGPGKEMVIRSKNIEVTVTITDVTVVTAGE